MSNLLKFSKNVDFKPKTGCRPFKNKFNWRVVRTNKKLNMAIITWYEVEVKPPSGVFSYKVNIFTLYRKIRVGFSYSISYQVGKGNIGIFFVQLIGRRNRKRLCRVKDEGLFGDDIDDFDDGVWKDLLM